VTEPAEPVDYTAIDLYRLGWTVADVAAFIALFRFEHRRTKAVDGRVHLEAGSWTPAVGAGRGQRQRCRRPAAS
jgi:hypothetical protein